MAQLVEQMNSTMDWVHKAGGDTAIQRHRSRGKMLPRERINSLIDPGSPFLELSPLAGKDLYGKTSTNASDPDVAAKCQILDGKLMRRSCIACLMKSSGV